MSFLDRISPLQRSRARRAAISGESRATREALAANIAGLARAMEERFVSLAERVAEVLAGRIDAALGEIRSAVDAKLDQVAREVAGLRDGQDFARVLRDLKRDLGAQISLASFEVAAEIRIAGLAPADRPA